MSAPHDDRPRYKPVQPTPEQVRAMREALKYLASIADETDGQANQPAKIDDHP